MFLLLSVEDDDGTYSALNDDGESYKLDKVSITLNDCLACSGCITSAESVLITQQSQHEVCFQYDPNQYFSNIGCLLIQALGFCRPLRVWCSECIKFDDANKISHLRVCVMNYRLSPPANNNDRCVQTDFCRNLLVKVVPYV